MAKTARRDITERDMLEAEYQRLVCRPDWELAQRGLLQRKEELERLGLPRYGFPSQIPERVRAAILLLGLESSRKSNRSNRSVLADMTERLKAGEDVGPVVAMVLSSLRDFEESRGCPVEALNLLQNDYRFERRSLPARGERDRDLQALLAPEGGA